ncbi:IS3 family transposase [Xanthomonas graminis]|uniref:IS3 family transposase n=1 Tax=Xanthomonas graminis TaxID=3390026 RepID=UPI001F00F1FA|nr:IS3 family transposase [Xanthomonas translucens]UKE71475.1 IS3 family transposase [Xanthomonas translucens pv. phleipratensis]
MSSKRYTQEFKVEAVKQVTERGHSVADVASRLGISIHSLYAWRTQCANPSSTHPAAIDQACELRRVKSELRRVTEERDILKKGRSVLCQAVRVRYAFMLDHEREFGLRSMCKVFGLHPSGYYAWRSKPMSPRAKDDARVLCLIKQSWLESGGVYGYRKITRDLRDLGESCGKHRTARLMRHEGLRAQVGYHRRPGMHGGKPAIVANNELARQFDPGIANQAWVTDITYIRTHEGWLYLAVVLDLFSRKIVGWAMHSTMHTDVVLQALMMAVWRRKPPAGLLVHSDQGTQFTGHHWQDFLKAHGLVSSMSRRGNCHDNAVAESFFQLLKRERIKRRIYVTREEAKSDVFNYIEMFYNTRRQHGHNNGLSPVEFEKQRSK